MGLREDVKYQLNKDWEPKVPGPEEVLKQAKMCIERGKSSGNVALDIKAIKSLKKDKEEEGER